MDTDGSDTSGHKAPWTDEIGPWSEIKHEIIKLYAMEYAKILARQKFIKGYYYVDAFAGGGEHIRKKTGELVKGSPLHVLDVNPRFSGYYFVDINAVKVSRLRELTAERENVNIFEGDCNNILVSSIFPRIMYHDFRRALCLIDPYKLQLSWDVLQVAGQMRSIEIFLNFPIHDINRNVLRCNIDKVNESDVERMNVFWGDESWRGAAYSNHNLFHFDEKIAGGNDPITQAFKTRLKEVAGFGYVPDPIPMRTPAGNIVYYLYFASPNKTGAKIVKHIFDKYRNYKPN